MTRSNALAPLVALLALALLAPMAGCGKRDDAPKKPRNLFSERPKIDYSQVKVDKPPPPVVAKPKVDTWATGTRDVVKRLVDDLQKCRNEYMVPFQFKKMRRKDVMWLHIGEMDATCRDGSRARKKRGPWKLALWLAKDEIGKHPDLDRVIALSLDHIEHFRTVSLMTKKIGSPEIELITRTAKEERDRVIAAGLELDKAARAIASWPDDELAHDDPKVLTRSLTPAEFRKLLADHYGFFLSDMVGAYDRFAAKSWQFPRMIKYKSLRTWAEIPTRHLQQDRARLGKVEGLSDKERAQITAYMDATKATVEAYTAGYARYMKDKKGTWSAKDPYRKPLVKAQRAWAKLHAKLLSQR